MKISKKVLFFIFIFFFFTFSFLVVFIKHVENVYASSVDANFIVQANVGEIPFSVHFYDTSTGSPDTWAWDFNEDGQIDSTEQNPVWEFTEAGTYSVSLTASNNESLDEITKSQIITVDTLLEDSLNTAISNANDGDTIYLPTGEYYIDNRIYISKFISLRGQGESYDQTRLYRREELTDSSLEYKPILFYACNSLEPSNIIVSNIHFKGKAPSQDLGDGGSTSSDFGLFFQDCVDFVVANNKIENFGRAGIQVTHKNNLSRGLIHDNYFYHNIKVTPDSSRKTTLGYGVAVAGQDENAGQCNPITGLDNTTGEPCDCDALGCPDSEQWIANPQFGTENFIFVEDNTFEEHRHAVQATGAGRYVFRNNYVLNNVWGQAVDAHGGGYDLPEHEIYSNTFSTRAYEVYDNTIETNMTIKESAPIKMGRPISEFLAEYPNPDCATSYPDNERAQSRLGAFRGGEGLIYNNSFEGAQYGLELTIEGMAEILSAGKEYPVTTQIGYEDGDVWMWSNSFTPFPFGSDHIDSCSAEYLIDQLSESNGYLTEDIDYHNGTAKPDYTAYTYPHPNQVATPTATPTVTPTSTPTPTNTPTPTSTPTPIPTSTPTPSLNRCGYTCKNNYDCTRNLICVAADDGNSYCSLIEYAAACRENPSYQTCCSGSKITATPNPNNEPEPTLEPNIELNLNLAPTSGINLRGKSNNIPLYNDCEKQITLSGTIYFDNNANGVLDKDEAVLSEAKLDLYYQDSKKNWLLYKESLIKTNANGFYELSICPGKYKIEAQHQELDSQGNSVKHQSQIINVTDDANNSFSNIGLVKGVMDDAQLKEGKDKSIFDVKHIAVIVGTILTLTTGIFVTRNLVLKKIYQTKTKSRKFE